MAQLLAGDIGGTKTILRLVSKDSSALEPIYEERYDSPSFTDLVPMVRQFFATVEKQMGNAPRPEAACFAIAGPVVDNTSQLTNLSWVLDGERLERELAIAHVSLINDFAAVGYGVLGLGKDDLHPLQWVAPQPEAPIAVIGAGTGLGQGFLIPANGEYQVFATEGGHTDFAPRSELEFQLLKYLLDKHNINRVSVERVVSGQGIVAVYQFLRDRQMGQESPEVAEKIRTWEREAGISEKTVDPAAVIAQAAAAGSDPLSEQAMQIFVTAYGAEAGNLALKLLPYGGLYIAGGIAAKNLPLMTSGKFMQAFADKGRVSSLLENVPIHVVLNSQVGLIGAAIRAARL
jgi:glucokinase